jgi:hypothetical protein
MQRLRDPAADYAQAQPEHSERQKAGRPISNWRNLSLYIIIAECIIFFSLFFRHVFDWFNCSLRIYKD